MAFLKFLVDLEIKSTVCLSLQKKTTCNNFSIELYLPIGSEEGGSDGGALYNILWRLSKSSLEQLKEQAKLSLHTLQTPLGSDTTIATSSFNSVFLLKSTPYRDHDIIIYIPYCTQLEIKNNEHDNEQDNKNSNNSKLSNTYQDTLTTLDNLTPWQFASEIARNIIIKALGDRAAKVNVLNYPNFPKER